MSEKEKTIEFMDKLVEAEDIIGEYIKDANHCCLVDVVKKRFVGIEKNCELVKIDPKDFAQNPYIKNINIGDWQVGDVWLNKFRIYEAKHTYVNGSRTRDPKTLTTRYSFCYFDEDTHYPSLGKTTPMSKWMGVEPAEINTFASFIAEAKGNVLLMGCGLAYVAYMLSLKADVNEITIVELDPNVIMMFQKYLKPQMNDKIKIMHGDAIKILQYADISKYQYCSVDIWHGAMDMFPIYLKCLLTEQRHPKTKFHYWLEEDLHVALECIWIQLMKPFIMDELKNEYLGIFDDILKMQNIKTVEDIRNFLLADKRPIIRKWIMDNPNEAYNTNLVKILAKF